jgi:hypothetical protein
MWLEAVISKYFRLLMDQTQTLRTDLSLILTMYRVLPCCLIEMVLGHRTVRVITVEVIVIMELKVIFFPRMVRRKLMM